MRLIAAIAVSVSMFASSAQAALITLNDLQAQTISGQNFNFVFNGAPASDGGAGVLILHAQGDYDSGGAGTPPDESLSWNAEGQIGAVGVGNFDSGVGGSGGPFDFVNLFQDAGNVEFQRTYALSPAVLTALLADSTINVFVDLTDEVNLFQPPNFVEITIKYNMAGPSPVPIPAIFPIFAAVMGLFGFIGWRRRRRATAIV